MAETSKIAIMANKVSEEIFGEFGWNRKGPEDQNWPCVAKEAHEVQTHPSDVVYWYEDPYVDAKLFFNVDLKSYAVGSLQKAQIRGAVMNLCKSTDCANVSSEWGANYGDVQSNYRCHGLLFVYNHDGEYDGDFQKLLESTDVKEAPLEEPNRVFVLNPGTVNYLATIANDLRVARGTRMLPLDRRDYSFYYPDLICPRPKMSNQPCASVEVLLGPWQIVRCMKSAEQTGGRLQVHYLVYYRGDGSSVDEFKYLFDAFFRFQMLGDEERISVRMPFAHERAHVHFDEAKDAYTADFFGLREFRARLNRIQFDPITSIVKQYSKIDLGMERHG